MAVTDFSPASVSFRGQAAVVDDGRTVLWLRGDHDVSTAAELEATVFRAMAIDTADVVLDLSGVDFIDAATIGVIVRARNSLVSESRSLTVRAPREPARRIFEVCGLTPLLEF